MDKGIELLIDRRKMFPEEFSNGGRWVEFLRLWRIDLDAPETHGNVFKFKHATFHEAVLNKLLVGEEPVNGILTIEEITKQSLQILEDELARLYKLNRDTEW